MYLQLGSKNVEIPEVDFSSAVFSYFGGVNRRQIRGLLKLYIEKKARDNKNQSSVHPTVMIFIHLQGYCCQ